MRLSLAMVLPALAILLLNVAMPARAFDSRLSIGAALDTSEFTIRTVFPASVGEQVHMFQFPFQFYGRQVDQIKIYSNGFIALGNHSLQVPPNYPSQTAYSKHRLNELEGDFIGVFTTVNQCSQNGNIIIRDLDVNEVESNTCVWDHVSRIGNIIDTAASYSTKRFVADYILTITWENMGCFPSSHPLVNTFTLALLRMEKKSYAVFQYENIQWTADHSTSSLPPEGGIFVHGVATPQLPRNNMHIEPNVWNEESNIAVPGEWLFPLYDAPIDVDVAAQSKIRMATEDFLETSAKNCANMTAPSAKTPFVSEPFTTAVTEIAAPYTTDYSSSQDKFTLDDDVRLTTDLEQQFERCSSSSCANSMADCFYFDGQSCCVCPPNYYGGGEEGCWSVAPEKPRRIYFDGDLRMNLAAADGKLVSASVFLSTEVRQGDTILSQSGIHDEPQNSPSIHVITPIFSILNTFLALSRSQDSGRMTSRLFNIFSLTAGFSTPFNFTFTLDVSNHGRLGIRGSLWRSSSTENTFRGLLNMEITPDGQFMPLSSRLIGSDGLLQTENKLDRSVVYEKSGSGKVTFGPQTYNLKSEEGQTISIRVYGSGETAVRKSSCLLMENSLMAKGQKFAVSMGAQGYCREDCRSNYGCSLYCVDVPVYSGAVSDQSEDVCNLPTEVGPCKASIQRYTYNRSTGRCEVFYYGGCKGNENNFEKLNDCQRLCESSYQKDPCAGVRCGLNAYCANGYCYCNSGYEGDANTECRPVSSGPCVNVRCGLNAYCASGYCYCNSGYDGDANTECRPTSSDSDLCRGVRCGYNARCIEGRCKCEEGYSGDPYRECRWERDPCRDVRCGANAYCLNGQCFCQQGYLGDPQIECRPSYEDRCRGIQCGYYAHCSDGRCQCDEGYTGDPYRKCQWAGGRSEDVCSLPTEVGPCLATIQRYAYNRSSGRCEVFYYGGCQGNANNFDNLEECQQRCESLSQRDPCANVRCDRNAYCVNGYCYCNPGYEGDGNTYCRPASSALGGDLCGSVRCGENAECLGGQCKCMEGYHGDPFHSCQSIGGDKSSPNPICRFPIDAGQCYDRMEKYGYDSRTGRCEKFFYTGCLGNENRFDTFEECERECGAAQTRNRCDGVQCASNAYCANGYCRCNPGYAGDGFIECHYQGSCANIQCGVNAHCVDGRCACWPGYIGDPDSRCDPAGDPSYCNGRRCGQNAVCDQDRCICKYGFEGDPYYGCTEITPKPERCGNTYCHEKARCHSGTCYCEYGYAGDGVSVCEKVEEDLCKRVHCAENAECEAGLCQCKPGFKGDGFSECNPVEVDPSSCNGRYCGANAECRDNVCVCVSGYTGDPYDICTRERPLSDSCHGIECGSNAYCQNGGCVCYEGFEGEPSLACKPIYDTSCMGIRCGANAYCRGGRCICPQGYMGDANQVCYPVWGSSTVDVCNNLACHPNASCSEGQCHCDYGFEGDGFIDCWSKDPANLCDCRGVPASMAGCSNGKCRCMPGFRMTRNNYCEECRGNGGCAANAQCIYDRQIQHYRCACDPDYLGDGAIACIPGAVANRTEAAQCRAPCHRFATCDEYDGRCKCRPGFIGNGYTYCDFDCNQCLSEAQCVPESSQCVCPPGYIGDGIRVCRPATSQGLFTLRIVKESETIRVREDSGALTLRCVLSGDVRNLQARWLTPGDVGRTDEQYTHEGRELWLTISQPSPKDSGLYFCQASRVSDTINVVVEPQQKIQTKQLFLTSDNGILTVQTQSESTTAAQIWHIAENNKHRPVALALDCKTDRLVYTSDAGRALRFGNASAARLNQPPELIFQDNSAKFTWIAVDPASGNIFAIDEDNSRIVVVNSDRPNQVHTYKKLTDRRSDRDFVAGGIAVHPGLSLVYWAQVANSDSEKRESVIKVASMADPERVSEITRVTGAPIALSLAVTDDVTGGGNTAGRLCWLQRRQLMPYSRTEIHCAQLETSGRTIHSKRLHKSFDTNEEPSCGLIQDDDTILWTSLYRKIYRSLNPSTSIYVKGVCCSNGFQSMAIHNICKRSMTNACSYENGRCRYFCLPGGREMAHICRCPDDQPNCIVEHAKSRFLGYAYS